MFIRLFILLIHVFTLFWSYPLRSQDFRVMSFNIRYPNQGDGIHYWDHRRPMVVSMIKFHAVDLLGVQEAHRRQLDEMVEDLPEYAWYGVCRTDGSVNPDPDGEFSAILYRKDRFERLEGNTFWLSESPDEIASVGWDAVLPRIVTWAKFKDKRTGKVFFHFNTHFDHIGNQARMESAKLLLEKAERIAGDMPVVVTGDFNCSHTDSPYLILTNETSPFWVTDAITISESPHHGPRATFAGNFEHSGLGDQRIDFIFIRNPIRVLKHAILSDSWNGHFASDHLPVFAEVIIN